MSKYIIDVGDAYVRHALGRKLIIPVIINNDTEYWVNTNIQLTPYTEPDTEKVWKEAYRQGYDKGYGTKVKKFYEQGLSDAWTAARKIVTMPDRGFINSDIIDLDPGESIFTKYTASEAIEKIRQYEQKEQKSITAEDVMRQYLDNFCKGRSCTGCPLHTPDFTCGRGKYFLYDSMSNEEVRRAYAEVLAKMKEES